MNERKQLNLFSCVAIIVSGMIGSAIYSLSGYTIQLSGAFAILSWLVAGIIMLFYGLFMCELATIFPKSGGAFYFPYKALGKNEKEGKLFGFISAWAYIISCITAISFSASYVGIYLSVGFTNFTNYQILFSILAIVFSYIYNSIDLKSSSKINNILTILLVLTLIIFIFKSTSSDTFSFTLKNNFDTNDNKDYIGFFKAIPTAMVGYGSIVAMSFMVSDVKDRKKNLFLAAIIAMTIVILLYCISIYAIVGQINKDELIDLDMIYIPFFAVCFSKLQNVTYLTNLVSISAVIALLTTISVMTALSSRAIQALSQVNVFPNALGKENKKSVPQFASTIVCVIALLLILIPNITNTLIDLGVLLNVIGVSFHLLSLYVARNKIKDGDSRMKDVKKDDIYKAPGNNIMIIIILILLLLCYLPDVLNGGYKIWLFTVSIYAIGLLYYKFFVR